MGRRPARPVARGLGPTRSCRGRLRRFYVRWRVSLLLVSFVLLAAGRPVSMFLTTGLLTGAFFGGRHVAGEVVERPSWTRGVVRASVVLTPRPPTSSEGSDGSLLERLLFGRAVVVLHPLDFAGRWALPFWKLVPGVDYDVDLDRVGCRPERLAPLRAPLVVPLRVVETLAPCVLDAEPWPLRLWPPLPPFVGPPRPDPLP